MLALADDAALARVVIAATLQPPAARVRGGCIEDRAAGALAASADCICGVCLTLMSFSEPAPSAFTLVPGGAFTSISTWRD